MAVASRGVVQESSVLVSLDSCSVGLGGQPSGLSFTQGPQRPKRRVARPRLPLVTLLDKQCADDRGFAATTICRWLLPTCASALLRKTVCRVGRIDSFCPHGHCRSVRRWVTNRLISSWTFARRLRTDKAD